MKLELENKVVLVTGSSRGLGAAIAQAFHIEGAKVVTNGRGQQIPTWMREPDSENIIYVSGDVVSSTDCRELVSATLSAWGKIDVLVCNVGLSASVSPGHEKLDEWRNMFDLNLFSTTNMVEATRHALAETRGNIICISSICGLEIINGAPLTYSSAKAALNFYIQGIAKVLGREGVRINGVAPGNMLFDGSVWDKKLHVNADAVEKLLATEVALGRLGTPEEITGMVLFLASCHASFMTGSLVTIDGGQVRT